MPHEKGIIHRDLKPGNLMVDSAGHCWVLDFGLADFLDRSCAGDEQSQDYDGTPRPEPGVDRGPEPALIARRGGSGTPVYMAPEQVGRRPVERRTDVWGLGVILYELLTLERAFGSSKEVESLTPPRPRALVGGIPRDLDAICAKSMEKEPSKRYPSAEELADDLKRWQSHHPVKARPASGVRRMALFARRHKAWAGLAATVAAAAVTLITVLLITNQRVNKYARAANTVLVDRSVERADSAMARRQFDSALGDLGLALGHGGDLPDVIENNRVRVLNVLRSNFAIRTVLFHDAEPTIAEFSPDAQSSHILTVAGPVVYIWDSANGNVVHTWTHTGTIYSAAFDPTASRVVTTSADKKVRVWALGSNQAVHVLPVKTAGFHTAQFDNSGSRVLIHPTGVGRDVKAWNFVAGTEIDLSHPDGVGAIAVSRSSPMMVTAAGQTVRLWSLDEAKSQYEWKLPDNGSRAWSVVAISDDGRLAAAGGSGMTVQLYDAVSGTIQWTNLAQPLGAVVSLRFSEIGSSLSVTTTTGSSVYDVSGGNRSCDTPDATQVFKPTRMLSSDRQRDLFIRPDHSVLVRDIAGLYRKCKYYRPPSTFAVRDLRPGPNGWIGCVGLVDDKESFGFCEPSGEFMGPWRNQLMTIDQEGFYVTASRKTIVRWALPGSNRAQKPTELDVDDAEPYLSPGGRFVARFHDRDSQRVLVWNVSTGSVVGEIRPFVTTQAKLEVMTLRAFVSPEGDRLITVAPMEPDRPQTPLPELLLWDVQAKKVLKSLGQSTENSRVTFSDNGRRVLVYSPYPADDPIRAFRLTDGRQVGPDLNAGPIVFAAISPDGLTIFTSGADNTGRVWDVATGSQICAFDSASLMLHASFRDDGRAGDSEHGSNRLPAGYDERVIALSPDQPHRAR